jgi:hypothetical protein
MSDDFWKILKHIFWQKQQYLFFRDSTELKEFYEIKIKALDDLIGLISYDYSEKDWGFILEELAERKGKC